MAGEIEFNMTGISIREATHEDSSILKEFLKPMVEEMAFE